MQEELKKLIDSVGAMAEMTVLYRNELAANLLPEKEVMRYTAAFITGMMGGSKNEGQ